MTPKSKNILVGMFVIFFSAGAVAFITWLGTTTVREETDTYLAYLEESVSGLSQNSPVKYKGVTIGQVEKIRINPENSNQVELQLMIKRGTPIKVDSELILTSQGITGLQYIEITGGSEEKGLLKAKPGDNFPVIVSGKSTLATVEAAIGPMLSNINLAIEDIRQVLKSASPERLTNILSDVESITETVADNSTAIVEDLNQTGEGLKQVVEQTNQLMDNANNFFNNREDQVVAMIGEVQQASSAVNRLLGSIEQEKIIGNLGKTVSHVDQLVENLNGRGEGPLLDLVEGMSQSTTRLNRLLARFEEEQIVQGVGKTITRVDQLVANVEEKFNGPVESMLSEIQQSAQAANRIVTKVEEEQLVEGVGQVVAKVEKIVDSLDQTASNADQFFANLNKTAGSVEIFISNLNQTMTKTDQFISHMDLTLVYVDQFISNLDQTTSNVDQFVSNLNTTASKVDQFIAGLDQTTEGIEDFMQVLSETAAKTDRFIGNLDRTTGNVDRFVGNLDQTAVKADRFMVNLNQSVGNMNQFIATMNRAAEKTDQFVATLNQTATEIDQLFDTLNDQVVENEFQAMPKSINLTLKEIRKLTGTLNQSAEDAEISSTMEDLKKTLEDIQTFAQTWTQVAEELENQPSALIFGESKAEINVAPE
ncbi:MAG: DUF2397 family protein [SAR324 cluster bacterium]|nr:DUF2397 family protein [SAR324 cluster bacterium]